MAAPLSSVNSNGTGAHLREDTLVDSPATASPSASTFLPPQRAPSTGSSIEEDPTVIPPDSSLRTFRTLVLCFDGTGDQFDLDNSNIVQFFSLLKKDDKSQQLVYYQAGIGTYTSPSVGTPIASAFSKTLDEMVAWNLHSHVMGGYEFLMQNYNAGDKICIFGFSRGAYTARSLAGMIHKVGILPKCNHQQVPFAYKMYTRDDKLGWKQSDAFKKTFSIDVEIEFVGVWDTVDSVGLIPRTLPFASSNYIVNTFRHAISLDERRAKFKANLWKIDKDRDGAKQEASASQAPAANTGANDKNAAVVASTEAPGPQINGSSKGRRDPSKPHAHTSPPMHERSDSLAHKIAHSMGMGDCDEHEHLTERQKQRRFEKEYSAGKGRNVKTDVDEVWFAGCHCDVGGGSVSNDTPASLARLPLRWMIRECFKTKSGIVFDVAGLRELGMDPTALWPVVKDRPPHKAVGDSRLASIPPPPAKRWWGKSKEEEEEEERAADPFVDSSSNDKPTLTEEDHELLDALEPIYDQLSLKWSWWLLEFLPVKQSVYHHKHRWFSLTTWASFFGLNLGRARHIPAVNSRGEECVRIHRSVKMRMEALGEASKDGKTSGKKYYPRALDALRGITERKIEWVA